MSLKRRKSNKFTVRMQRKLLIIFGVVTLLLIFVSIKIIRIRDTNIPKLFMTISITTAGRFRQGAETSLTATEPSLRTAQRSTI